MANEYSCFLFSEIPGTWRKWILAVFATSLQDARKYMRIQHGGGKYIGEVSSGKVRADCGALTEKAQIVISSIISRESIA